MTIYTSAYRIEPAPETPRRRPVSGRRGLAVASAFVVLTVMGTTVASSANTSADVPAVRIFAPPVEAPPLSSPLQPVSHWAQAFLVTWNDELRMSVPLSTSGDSWDQYQLSYPVDSNTAMFRATGETRYLDRALLYVDNVVAKARVSSSFSTSQYRDRYLGWISKSSDLDTPGIEAPLYESYFWRYATTMLRAMRQTPAVYDDPRYRAEYDRLVGFAEVNIFDKWYQRGANDNIYRSETHMASHWAMIALNLSVITTDPGRRARYRTVVDNIDLHLPNARSSLRQQLIRNPVNGSAYFWSEQWGSFRKPGQDVSHGNGVMAYVVEAGGQGGNWTETDMARFGAVLTTVLQPHDGVYPAYVDGSGRDNGWIADGFVKLGRYSPAVQQWLEHYPEVNDQFFANMALNAKMLG
jgi:hypothetical protein